MTKASYEWPDANGWDSKQKIKGVCIYVSGYTPPFSFYSFLFQFAASILVYLDQGDETSSETLKPLLSFVN